MRYLLLFFSFMAMTSPSFADNRSLIIELPSQMVPSILCDPKTKIIYYLESDRHHLSAIGPKGILLWRIDSMSFMADGKLTPGQINKNFLMNFIKFCDSDYFIKVTHRQDGDFLWVSFNSGAWGLIRKSDGTFIFLGQD